MSAFHLMRSGSDFYDNYGIGSFDQSLPTPQFEGIGPSRPFRVSAIMLMFSVPIIIFLFHISSPYIQSAWRRLQIRRRMLRVQSAQSILYRVKAIRKATRQVVRSTASRSIKAATAVRAHRISDVVTVGAKDDAEPKRACDEPCGDVKEDSAKLGRIAVRRCRGGTPTMRNKRATREEESSCV